MSQVLIVLIGLTDLLADIHNPSLSVTLMICACLTLSTMYVYGMHRVDKLTS